MHACGVANWQLGIEGLYDPERSFRIQVTKYDDTQLKTVMTLHKF